MVNERGRSCVTPQTSRCILVLLNGAVDYADVDFVVFGVAKRILARLDLIEVQLLMKVLSKQRLNE